MSAREAPSLEAIWRRYDDVEARLAAPLSERMLDLAALRPGMRVLDLATGRGEPAIRAAGRVGPAGHVVGVEPSEGVLRIAAEAAARAGVTNLELRVGRAEAQEGIAAHTFDAVTCRWGLMFMDDPIAALENARRALTADGVLVAALWAEPERVGWFTLPRKPLARYRPLPTIDPEAPGLFRFADPARIARDFARAGFTIDVEEEVSTPVFESTTTEEMIAWFHDFGLGKLLDDVSEADRQAWARDVADALIRDEDGMLRIGGVTRIVRARPA